MSAPEEFVTLRRDAERLEDQLSHASSRSEALDIAIKAAETSMKALSLVQDPAERAACRSRAEQYMREAERIKHDEDWRSRVKSPPTWLKVEVPPTPRTTAGTQAAVATKVRQLPVPLNSRKLSTREKIIVTKAGFLNGVKFPEWSSDPSPKEFELADGEDLFFDEASELPLSEFQEDVLDSWKRPQDALPPPSWFQGDKSNLGPTMGFFRNIDLVQDAATDCSVVASLCAGVARVQNGHPRMLQNVMHPFNFETGGPIMSKNGKYIVSMNFNGCQRRVVIDDRIPTSSTNRVIHVIDRNNPGLLWPALIEKAYLKVRGGYDFPGSNSGTDLWILTGWIPEQIHLQGDDLELDRLWSRMLNAFSYGDVLVTMGTGKMSDKTERALGLASEHDYAVLDLREVGGQRLMLVKNPWVEGTSWRGRSRRSERSQEMSPEGPRISLDEETGSNDSPRDLLNEKDLPPGTFWMDLDSVQQYFESVYLNWNPGLFKYRQDAHFEWDFSKTHDDNGFCKSRGPTASLQHNPQFTVTTSQRKDVWILLWRHFQNSVPEDATAEDIESGRHYIDLSGYITLAAFSAQGRKVMLSERYIQKGWYVDSPQTLLKLENCEPGKPYTIVPLEQDLPANKHSFTICTFSNSPVELNHAIPRYAHLTHVNGSWTQQSAGGNTQNPTYCDNPQYTITVPKKTNISLLLEASNPKYNVNVRLLHSGGERVFNMRKKDIIADSTVYRQGCCIAELDELDPGKYTAICSTFDPQQLGDFTLRIDSAEQTFAKLLPREGAGRIRFEVKGAAFKEGMTKIAAPMVPHRLVNFYAIARQAAPASGHGRSGSRSHIRLSVEHGREPSRFVRIESNNGEYSDTSGGAVRTDAIDLGPNDRMLVSQGCMLVLDRMYVSSENLEETFQVELYMDQPNAIAVGPWRAWDD
ncbi:hypothetical protein CBER1_00142 [Cercospora berteroae]|uniref:Calpain catalytic domain-containing protein n=1 Tax=Cercospora berteroae TaxID=357750 RepID=A0A2S6CD74_9PEZI|nr:hypothetical protein CBER1_00142 [Cercospora berteroae]